MRKKKKNIKGIRMKSHYVFKEIEGKIGSWYSFQSYLVPLHIRENKKRNGNVISANVMFLDIRRRMFK